MDGWNTSLLFNHPKNAWIARNPPDSYAILENLNPKLSRKHNTYKYNNIIDQVNDLWKRQYNGVCYG